MGNGKLEAVKLNAEDKEVLSLNDFFAQDYAEQIVRL